MKILFVLENYFPKIGGVETLFKTLIEELALDEANQITVITSSAGAAVPKKEQQGNISIIRLNIWNRYLFTFLALWPVLKQAGKHDLIHTTSYNAALPAFLGALFGRKKVIITFHEVWGDLWFNLPYMSRLGRYGHYLFEQLLLRLSFTRFIAVSESTAEGLRKAGVPPERVKMIYNGINYDEFSGVIPAARPSSLQQHFIYTYFGRLGVSKGLDILLASAEELKLSLPESRLQLIIPTEPAPFYQEIISTIEQKDLTDYIILKHHLPFEELKATLCDSDCVVIPSYSEGFCFAAVEAIALGVAIISSDQAALKEVISGRFLKLERLDSPSLVAAIHQAKEGEWEVSPVQQYELSNTLRQYLVLYAEVLQ